MFIAVGLGVAHIAHKVGEGDITWPTALALAMSGALFGGIGSRIAGMSFYDVVGQMVVGLGCATLCILIWRQLRA
jgi:uncharacterized membrane protein YfcA